MILRGALIGIVTAFALSACGARALPQSGGHRFDVPAQHLIPASARPFFLPPSDADFTFVLNPDAALPEQVLVLVQSQRQVCARAAGREAWVNATICGRRPADWRGWPLRKVGDATFWNYAARANGSGKAVVVASCFAAAGGGLCSATLPWRDNVLMISFRDSEAGSLEKLFDQATALLAKWER